MIYDIVDWINTSSLPFMLKVKAVPSNASEFLVLLIFDIDIGYHIVPAFDWILFEFLDEVDRINKTCL